MNINIAAVWNCLHVFNTVLGMKNHIIILAHKTPKKKRKKKKPKKRVKKEMVVREQEITRTNFSDVPQL